jgi:hypothetical protein
MAVWPYVVEEGDQDTDSGTGKALLALRAGKGQGLSFASRITLERRLFSTG